jgi:hypothetical protein
MSKDTLATAPTEDEKGLTTASSNSDVSQVSLAQKSEEKQLPSTQEVAINAVTGEVEAIQTTSQGLDSFEQLCKAITECENECIYQTLKDQNLDITKPLDYTLISGRKITTLKELLSHFKADEQVIDAIESYAFNKAVEAIEKNDVEYIKKLFKTGLNFASYHRYSDGNNLPHYAVINYTEGNDEIIDILLQHMYNNNIGPMFSNKEAKTPLDIAKEKGLQQIAKKIEGIEARLALEEIRDYITHFEELSQKGENEWKREFSQLFARYKNCFKLTYSDVLHIVIYEICEIYKSSNSYERDNHYAIKYFPHPLLKYIIEQELTDINYANLDGETALLYAIKIQAKPWIIEYLLQNGADLLVKNAKGQNIGQILEECCATQNINVSQENKSAESAIFDNDEKRPAFQLLRSNYKDNITYIIHKSMLNAIDRGDLVLIMKLWEETSIDFSMVHQLNPLYYTIEKQPENESTTNILKFFIDKKVDVNKSSKSIFDPRVYISESITPLHVAILKKNNAAKQLLIDNGANRQQKAKLNSTRRCEYKFSGEELSAEELEKELRVRDEQNQTGPSKGRTLSDSKSAGSAEDVSNDLNTELMSNSNQKPNNLTPHSLTPQSSGQAAQEEEKQPESQVTPPPASLHDATLSNDELSEAQVNPVDALPQATPSNTSAHVYKLAPRAEHAHSPQSNKKRSTTGWTFGIAGGICLVVGAGLYFLLESILIAAGLGVLGLGLVIAGGVAAHCAGKSGDTPPAATEANFVSQAVSVTSVDKPQAQQTGQPQLFR